MSFCGLIKGISTKICILCVGVKINKPLNLFVFGSCHHSVFEYLCYWAELLYYWWCFLQVQVRIWQLAHPDSRCDLFCLINPPHLAISTGSFHNFIRCENSIVIINNILVVYCVTFLYHHLLCQPFRALDCDIVLYFWITYIFTRCLPRRLIDTYNAVLLILQFTT